MKVIKQLLLASILTSTVIFGGCEQSDTNDNVSNNTNEDVISSNDGSEVLNPTEQNTSATETNQFGLEDYSSLLLVDTTKYDQSAVDKGAYYCLGSDSNKVSFEDLYNPETYQRFNYGFGNQDVTDINSSVGSYWKNYFTSSLDKDDYYDNIEFWMTQSLKQGDYTISEMFDYINYISLNVNNAGLWKESNIGSKKEADDMTEMSEILQNFGQPYGVVLKNDDSSNGIMEDVGWLVYLYDDYVIELCYCDNAYEHVANGIILYKYENWITSITNEEYSSEFYSCINGKLEIVDVQ